jgi:hypothetical protein
MLSPVVVASSLGVSLVGPGVVGAVGFVVVDDGVVVVELSPSDGVVVTSIVVALVVVIASLGVVVAIVHVTDVVCSVVDIVVVGGGVVGILITIEKKRI